MILIYSPQTSPRLAYTAKFLFSTILGIPASFTSNTEEYSQYTLPKINYSNENLDGITLLPHSLLFEDTIKSFVPEFFKFNDFPTLFPVSNESALPFDPFAATFFMISRYEEYLKQPVDQHHRTIPNHTLAYKNNFLEIPVVDSWALMLRRLIEKKYPNFMFPEREYRFIPTIDVDVAYAYRCRGLLRTVGASLKSLLKQNWKDNKRRFQTLFFNQTDPFDTFSLLSDWHDHHNLKPVFFFLVGQYGQYDKNLPASNVAIKHLIRDISEKYTVGIHPSYRSNYLPIRVTKEIERLHKITGTTISRSRQHFLMLQFPHTYQQLISSGISKDYTMGYASMPGFRAGTCTPFPFYDLSKELETSLTIYPFQIMDGTLNQYLKLSPLEAVERISRLNAEVRKVNGTFITLWHNESLGEMRHWKNWREVYEALIKIAS